MKPKFLLNAAITVVALIFAVLVMERNASLSAPAVVPHFGFFVENEGESFVCLGCHDGQLARQVNVQRIAHGEHPSVLGSHPVDIRYPGASSMKRGFAGEEELQQAGLRLVEGKVTCTTCHDLRLSQHKYFLPPSLNGTGLCQACHHV